MLVEPIVTFADLGLPADLLATLSARGLDAPFPIQVLTIPDGLAGRDVCGEAKTGSGKTLAFGIPLVLTTKPGSPGRPTALVLVPTRELAQQVDRELQWLAEPFGRRVVAVYGGLPMDRQRQDITAGVDVVVATPGRLIDLMNRGDLNLGDVRFLVLDEADRMCDMGFKPNVEWLLRHMPEDRQTLLFSATLASDVNFLVKHYLRDPIRHSLVSEGTDATVEQSVHRFLQVHAMDQVKVVAAITKPYDRSLVFLNTKRACDRLVDNLREMGVQAKAIHGDLTQDQRNRALRQFMAGQIRVLVATDVAARGLHIDAVDVVIQHDLPEDHKTYVHRAGRTARAGAEGQVVTLLQWNQQRDVDRIQKRLGLSVPVVEVFSNDPRLGDLDHWDPTGA